jgi:hypothetical protein
MHCRLLSLFLFRISIYKIQINTLFVFFVLRYELFSLIRPKPEKIQTSPAGPVERRKMKPIVLAMIICDFYYRDAHSGKSILSGTFSSINSPSFPSKHGNCAVYIALTDVARDGKLQLSFRKEGGSFSMNLPAWDVKCPESRRAVVEIGGNINGLPIPEEGYYEFAVLWDGNEISSRRLKASKIELRPPQNESPEMPGAPLPPEPENPQM